MKRTLIVEVDNPSNISVGGQVTLFMGQPLQVVNTVTRNFPSGSWESVVFPDIDRPAGEHNWVVELQTAYSTLKRTSGTVTFAESTIPDPAEAKQNLGVAALALAGLAAVFFLRRG